MVNYEVRAGFSLMVKAGVNLGANFRLSSGVNYEVNPGVVHPVAISGACARACASDCDAERLQSCTTFSYAGLAGDLLGQMALD